MSGVSPAPSIVSSAALAGMCAGVRAGRSRELGARQLWRVCHYQRHGQDRRREQASPAPGQPVRRAGDVDLAAGSSRCRQRLGDHRDRPSVWDRHADDQEPALSHSALQFAQGNQVVIQVLEGENAVALNREIMGATDPVQVAERALSAARTLDRMDPPMRTFIALDEADVRRQAEAGRCRSASPRPSTTWAFSVRGMAGTGACNRDTGLLGRVRRAAWQ